MSAIQHLITEHLDIWTAADTGPKSGRGRSAANAAKVYGISKLRELILELAVRGKLVPQDASDEPASELLKRIQAEKAKLLTKGKIKKDDIPAAVTEEEKPFEIPHGWEWVRLGQATEVLDSLRRPVTRQDREPGPYPYYGASGVVDYVSNYIFDEPLVLVGEDGAKWGRGENTAFLISGKTWVNNHAHVIRPYRTALTDSFLVCTLNAMDLGPFITGMTVPKLNQAKLISIALPLPPITEQHRIVAKVDELMALCDQLETEHNNATEAHEKLVGHLLGTLTQSQSAEDFSANWQRIATHFDTLFTTEASIDALKQTLLQLAVMGKLVPQDPNDEPASELLKRIQAEKAKLIAEGKIKKEKPLPPITNEEKPFDLPHGWQWVRIENFCDVQGGIQKTPLRAPKKNHFPYLRVANVQRGWITVDELERYELLDSELDQWRLKSGDILVVEGNGSANEIGRCAIWEGQVEDCVFQNHLMRVRPWHVDFVGFLELFLNSPIGSEEMRRLAITTSGLFNLSVGKIRNIVVAFPPEAEQLRIVAKVDELMTPCDQLELRLTEANRVQQKLADVLVEQALS